MPPLTGLRVVDLTEFPAGWRASGILADHGADVIWIEPSGPSEARRRFAVEHAVFNRNKRSVVLDTAREQGRLADLLATADVVFEGRTDQLAKIFGVSPDEVHSSYPTAVICSISGFGTTGPTHSLPAEEAIVHAIVGTMGEQIGHRDGPIFEGLPFASLGAAHLAVIGVLAAIHRRGQDGIGRHVETSLLDGTLVYLSMFWGESDAESPQRSTVVGGSSLVARSTRLITGSFLCADDGYVSVHTGAVGGFGRLMRVLGLDDRIQSSDTGLDMGLMLTPGEKDLLYVEIHKIFAEKSRTEWVDLLVAADVCGIPQLHPTEVFDEPQSRFNGMVVTIDDDELGCIEQVAAPIKFIELPPVDPLRAPRSGEHTADIFAELAADAEGARARGNRRWLGSGSFDDRPLLSDIRILDLGAYYAGPFASRLLADLGADVIKLEPVGGDPLRGVGPLFRAAQAGKRSIAADLKDPALADATRGLIGWADVVHHNMRPGAAERLGIGGDQVREINPRAIYGYAPGWGAVGPFAERQSFEPMMSGYVGAGFEVAGQFNPPLYPLGNADPGNGLVGAIAMLIALLHRSATGHALRFHNPQLNATMAHVAHIVRRDNGDVLGAERLDPLQYGVSALERLYECRDGWVCIVAVDDAALHALGTVIGVDLAADPRFATAERRADNDYELSDVIAGALQHFEAAALVETLTSVSVPAAVPVPYNNSAFMRDDANRRTGRVAECTHPTLGRVRELASFIRISDTAVADHRLAPELGADTLSILTEFGYPTETVAQLRDRGVIRLG